MGFELHPEIPAGGMDIYRMFRPAQVEAMHARLSSVADGMGVPFTPRRHAPSTRPALAISDLARERGRLDAWREAAMNAHWRDGLDIEDRDVLRELAELAGLDADEALAVLDRPDLESLIQAQRLEAYRWGVNSIPTWFMLPSGWTPGDARPPEDEPQPVRVVGCQPMEVVEQAAQMAGATPRA